jgi:hypothetical protein
LFPSFSTWYFKLWNFALKSLEIVAVEELCSACTAPSGEPAKWNMLAEGDLAPKRGLSCFAGTSRRITFFVIPAAADFVFLAAWARSSFLRNYNFTYQTSCTLFIRSQPLSLSCCMSSTNTQHGQVYVYKRVNINSTWTNIAKANF